MVVRKNVDLEKEMPRSYTTRKVGKYAQHIKSILNDECKNILIEVKTEQEMNTAYNTIRQYLKRMELRDVICTKTNRNKAKGIYKIAIFKYQKGE